MDFEREIFSQGTWFLLIMWGECHIINYPAWYINGKHWFQLQEHVLLIQMSDTGCKPPFYHVNWRWIARTWDQRMGLFIMLLKLSLSDTEMFFSSLKWKGNCQPENHMSDRAVIFSFSQYSLKKNSNTVAGKEKKARKCKLAFYGDVENIVQVGLWWKRSIRTDQALLQCLCQAWQCLWEGQRLDFGEAWDKTDKCAQSCKHYPSRSPRKTPQFSLVLTAQCHFMWIFC